MTLTPEQIATFETNGFISGIDVAEPVQVRRTQEAFAEFETRAGREKIQTGLGNLHFEESFVWELVTNPTVLDCAESLLGPDIMVLGSRTFCKYGPSDEFVAWHQDVKYWRLDPPFAINAWIAIDDSDAGNGCVRFIPGSHEWGIRDHGTASQEANLLSQNQQVILSEEEEAHAVDNELRAGQMSIHHGLMAHGSRPNRSDRRRCGIAMIYVPTDTKPVPGSQPSWKVALVRGRMKECGFEEIPHPFN